MTSPATAASDPFAAFRACLERKDVDAAVALMADDVTFLSPVVHRPYVGREAMALILGAVVTVFEDFRYTASYASAHDAGASGHVLAFEARIGDRALQGVDILAARDGTINGLTVMVRPFSAVTALRERMAALL